MNLELVVQTDGDNPVEGDLKLTAGQLTLVDGTDAIAQHLRNRLRMFLGEWFLDLRLGLPFYQRIFVKNPNLSLIRSLFRRAIQSTPGIDSVSELTLTVDADRLARINFVASLETGGAPLVFEDFVLGSF